MITFYYYISSQTKSQLIQVFWVVLLSRAFGRFVIMNGELQTIWTRDHLEFFVLKRLVNSTSQQRAQLRF